MNHYPPHQVPPHRHGPNPHLPRNQYQYPQNQLPQNPFPQNPFPQHPRPPRRPHTLVRWLAIGFGVVLVLGLFSTLASGGDSGGYSDAGYSDAGEPGESGGSSQIYDSGSITTTDDGELIYSDNSGNSYSTGG